ncbi:Fur family transcriptional regulator [Halonatronum saccharophilum]|uniref:Fur family transcriptional regulator n=1 Tax=Halonatronum saccharophilum TaxID=150060 RepID=UPI00047FDC17|nr:Fur family transcriptional regulator [Halonatronum saccharophilum]
MDKLFLLEERLKDKGIRLTKQRSNILKVLIDAKRPISAQEIFNRLDNKDSKLRLSTVYRNLNRFEKEGFLKSVTLSDKEKWFELADRGHHHHLICIKCDDITPLDCPLKDFEDELKKETDYTILEHRMNMYGICPKCKISVEN